MGRVVLPDPRPYHLTRTEMHSILPMLTFQKSRLIESPGKQRCLYLLGWALGQHLWDSSVLLNCGRHCTLQTWLEPHRISVRDHDDHEVLEEGFKNK